MDKKMEEYLKNVALPEYESPGHRQELRQKLLDEMKRRHQMATKRNLRRLIYVIAVLVGLSALALAGTKYIRKWYFVEERDGSYIFKTETEETGVSGLSMTSIVSVDSESKEQAEKDLMEMEQLKASGKRELLEAKEIETDIGETIRIHRYKYVLSDGREITMNEDFEDRSPEEIKATLDQEYEGKLRRAKEGGKRDLVGVFEIEIDGTILSSYHVIYRMPDGSGVDASESSFTEETMRAAVGQDYDYLTNKLIDKNPDEVLPVEEREFEGKKFTFTRGMIRLHDGREVVYSNGRPSESKWPMR